MNETENNKSESEPGGLVSVQITDVLGLSKSAVELRKASENILKSLEKGIGKLSDPIISVIQAKADAKSLGIRGEAALEIRKKELGILSAFIKDIEGAGGSQDFIQLVERASTREVIEAVSRQEIREQVCTYLLDELNCASDIEVADDTIEDDWLTLFWRSVENKSSEDMQRLYARILAGECLQPGSYSSRLLHILSVMTQQDAMAFEAICNMSIEDEGSAFLLEPLEEVSNFLDEEIARNKNMGDFEIADLESLGLLGRASIVAFHEDEDGTIKNLGGQLYKLSVVNPELLNENRDYLSGIPLTKPAQELRSIISLQPNNSYFSALKQFCSVYLGVEFESVNVY